MKLLISPSDEKEALEAVAGGADIIDVKNPREGALGASFPWTIKRIREIAPDNVEVSCTIGDLPNLPGSVSLAVLGAAVTGVNYIKVGLGGVKTMEDAVFLLRNAVRAAKNYNSSIKVAATVYADAARINSVNPLLVPEIAEKANADVAMVDTSVKDGKNLFTFLTNHQLTQLVREAHDRGLLTALAGSLGAAKNYDSSINVAATVYADAARINSVNPLLVPEIADKANADVAMVDTSVKDGKNLFTFLTNHQLTQLVREAHDRGLLTALAGSLGKEQIHMVRELGADIIGLRGAACTGGDRVNGRIARETVRELADLIRSVEKQTTIAT